MCNVSLELNDNMAAEVLACAKKAGMTLEQYIKHLINEDLEDKYDEQCADKAYEEFLADPETISLEEIAKKYGYTD